MADNIRELDIGAFGVAWDSMKDTPEGQTHYADDATLEHIEDLERQLAEAQAREKQLLDSLIAIKKLALLVADINIESICSEALAFPQDSTALDKLVKDAKIDALEEAAIDCEEWMEAVKTLNSSLDSKSQQFAYKNAAISIRRMAQKLREVN